MMKKLLYLSILLLMVYPNNLGAQKNTGKATKSKVQKITPADLEVQKFRKENSALYEGHPLGVANTYSDTGIDYSNFNGKNCTEIARKENWGNWNPPVDADKRCEKFLKMKKVKKVMFYPVVK